MPYNIQMADVADWCYMAPYILLLSLKDVLQPQQLPVFKKGYFGHYNQKASRDRMTASERFDEDELILLELLPEFAMIQQFDIELPVEDEITKGLVAFVEDKKVPVWLCFATQVLLDVHHGLRHSNGRAFNDLRLSALSISKTIDEHWDFSRPFVSTPTSWPKEGDQNIQTV